LSSILPEASATKKTWIDFLEAQALWADPGLLRFGKTSDEPSLVIGKVQKSTGRHYYVSQRKGPDHFGRRSRKRS